MHESFESHLKKFQSETPANWIELLECNMSANLIPHIKKFMESESKIIRKRVEALLKNETPQIRFRDDLFLINNSFRFYFKGVLVFSHQLKENESFQVIFPLIFESFLIKYGNYTELQTEVYHLGKPFQQGLNNVSSQPKKV